MQTIESTAQAIEQIRPTRSEIDADLITRLRQQLGLIHRDEYCAVTRRTVRAVKRDWTLRRGPRPIRLGNEIFYRLTDCHRYIEEIAKGEGT